MLISLSNKFVFIAGLKAASTAIETALKSSAQLALIEARFGKHQPFREIDVRFGWMLRQIDPGELLVFGVMRDPVDYMISLYNSHTAPRFKENPDLYTAGMDFDRFLGEWTVRNHDQVEQQYRRFVDHKDRIAANYIISYDQLDEGLRFVSQRIGVEGLVPLGRENESNGPLDRSSLTGEQSGWIEAHFAQDREILSGYCNRLLTSRTQVSSPAAEQGTSAGAAATPSDRGKSATPEEIVDILYRATLRRPPDESGQAVYAAQLRAGRSELDVVRALAGSPEFAGKRLVPVAGEYDIHADRTIQKHTTEDALRITERIRKCVVGRDAFHVACLAALKELEGNREFHESQEKYLQVHEERFHELACAVGNLLEDFIRGARILDFGYSVNSLILHRLFPESRVAVADRPGVKIRSDRFDEIHTVDLLDDRLDEIDLERRFDIIVFSEVIEHLQTHPTNVARFLLRHLTDDGYVVLTTPNLFARSKLRLIGQRRSPLPPYPPTYGRADSPHFHVREYGMGEMLSMIEAAGGSISAFFFSACWDRPETRDAIPPHELGNLFVVFQRSKGS
jgi:SAM-dependent methyltransferase